MHDAGPTTGLGRIRDLWWPEYLALVGRVGLKAALNSLDECMFAVQDRFMQMARDFALDRGHGAGTNEFRISETQFVKSNLGKMFERFCGLALAYALAETDGRYCIQPFRAVELAACQQLSRERFMVGVVFGDGHLFTPIDADLFAYNPMDDDDELFLISVKSTLKDRFHNVPFWNLLRRAAVSGDFADIEPADRELLARVRYVAICSDIALEQPDFRTDAGARNLLQIDAALLDCAYVASGRARGLPNDCLAQLGEVRQHAFYRFACFLEYLT
jgi:hypothetical protein